MKQDIRLYLSGMKVDFKEDPKILFTYKVTDTQNPTAVKNNFSKTVSIEGTDSNNAIFGAIYDLSRMQTYGAGTYSGTDFNPLKKADFELYVDSELYETGYFKLTEITKTGTNVVYSITLFGGLGAFLANLQESANGNKLEFKDLVLTKEKDDTQAAPDLGLNISKEAVNSAWTEIDTYSSKFFDLNFVPAYNGIPDNFDANKVLINATGKSASPMSNISGISSYHNWAMGECSREMTEWETRDLRSYLMRPALRVRTLINTCCNPINNGGYEVELDDHFFSNDNPYYGNAWITLGMIKDIIGTDSEGDTEQITGATITGGFRGMYDIVTAADFSDFNNLDMTLRINMAPYDSAATDNSLYLCTKKKVKGAASLLNSYVKSYYQYYSAVLLQLVAFNEIGEVVASSNAYQLSTEVPGEDIDFTDTMNKDIEVPAWTKLWGYFAKSGDTYTWVDKEGNPQEIRFRFPSSTAFHTLKLRVQRPYYNAYRKTGFAGQKKIQVRYPSGSGYLWKNVEETVNGNHEPSWYTNNGAKSCDDQYSLTSFYVTATRYGGFLSGKYISQDRFLTLGITPADFLLSYIKLFGLHIWKDPIEKKIFIADRSRFYRRDDVKDINELIDRSKPIKITPQVAQAKWYDFNTDQNESEANSEYTENYGLEFGLQRVNTSYDFDSSVKEVYDGKFRGGVQVLEKSGYYYNDYNLWPVYCYNGMKLTTYTKNAENVYEGVDQDVYPLGDIGIYPYNPDYDGFDLFDKPQFHTENNSASDGALALLFYAGKIPCITETAGGIFYHLTDDIEEMVAFNDKTPCWIYTEGENAYGGTQIGIRVSELPKFSRYITYEENGYVTHTWDFGRTMETYVPGTVLTNGCSVYEKCWKDYISDMYDVNSRLISCYCLINGRANNDWLRRFYFWDNSLWRLNAIKEWNPGTYGTTLCEFLKVNNLEAYDLDRITSSPVTDFYLPAYRPTAVEERTRYYTIGSNISAVTVNVEVQDGGTWYYGDGPGSEYKMENDNGFVFYAAYTSITQSHTDSGRGNTSDVFLIGTNNTAYAKTYRFNIVVYAQDGDEFYTIYLRQEPVDIGSISISRWETGNVPAEGGTLELRVNSDYAWSAELAYSGYTSIDRYYAQSGTTVVTMTVQPNESASPRPCTITVTNTQGSSYTYTVEQNGAGTITQLGFTASDTEFGITGETLSATVQAIDSWYLTSYPSWITPSATSGTSGTTSITLTAAANTGAPRSANVTVTSGVETKTVQFSQEGDTWTGGIEITLDTYDFPGSGATVSGTVRSSVDWHFEPSGYWIVPSINYGGTGITPFTLEILLNNGRYGRVGTLAAQGGSYRDEKSITQNIYGQ